MSQYDVVSQYWDKLYNVIKESEIFLEKWIMQICSGMLALSVAILPFCIRDSGLECLPMLIISWLILLSGLVISLISHFVSKYNSQEIIDYIDSHDDYENVDISKVKCKIVRCNNLINSLNVACVVLIFVGIILFGSFLYINLIKY